MMGWASWIRNGKHSLGRRWTLHQALRRKPAPRRCAVRPRLEVLEDRSLLSTYSVTSAGDSGAGTLRDAITQANNTSSGITEIDFNIGTQGSSSGVQTISPATALPALTASGVFINGFSENIWQGVTLSSTSPLIELNGASAGTGSDGLQLTGANNTVSELIIENFTNGIEVGGASNVIGDTAAGAGGMTAGARNVLSGNTNDGLLIDSSASGVLVQGNYIGTDITGSTAVANSIGILVNSSQDTIGGSVAGAKNVLSGNTGDGVQIASGVSGVLLLGNYIGTNHGGGGSIANGTGVEVSGSNNTIGAVNTGSTGSTPIGGGNLIAFNATDGVLIASSASGNLLLGDYVGIGNSGNSGNGVEVAGNNNTIGSGKAGGEAMNIFISNMGDGVLLDGGSSGNQVQGNYIGTTNAGTAALGNKGNGVEVVGSNNTLGRNIISGNANNGVLLGSQGLRITASLYSRLT
jgi:hypothetical protein